MRDIFGRLFRGFFSRFFFPFFFPSDDKNARRCSTINGRNKGLIYRRVVPSFLFCFLVFFFLRRSFPSPPRGAEVSFLLKVDDLLSRLDCRINLFVVDPSSVLDISRLFLTEFSRGFNWFYWVLLGFTGFYGVLLGFTGFYGVLLVFTGFYGVLLGFT